MRTSVARITYSDANCDVWRSRSAACVLLSDQSSKAGSRCDQVCFQGRETGSEGVVFVGGLPELVFEPMVVPGEFVDALGQVRVAEGIELLSELVPDGLPHPFSVSRRVRISFLASSSSAHSAAEAARVSAGRRMVGCWRC
ncbi:hypothetical protein [Streptomyces sp. NPDC001816]|uniref:hypothetical protein n=1 Tax=Streptomyces sp. NPDC001816 TaxID=3364612 RepID=UPI0036812158